MMLAEGTLPRTLDEIVAHARPAAGRLEAWVFEDRTTRRWAEADLAARGVEATFRSAYKPLLHFFMEEVDVASLAAAHIRYPVHPAATPLRFLSEAYPLAGMLPAATFEPDGDELVYRVRLTDRDGAISEHAVFAPNDIVANVFGDPVLTPTGWLRDGQGRDEAVVCDAQRLYRAVLDAVVAHSWGPVEPYFRRLQIAVEVPPRDVDVGFGDEFISMAEALHEELYFSLLEHFQRHSGRAPGDRRLQPGQIAPLVTGGADAWRFKVETVAFDDGPQEVVHQDIEGATVPPSAIETMEVLAGLGGTPLGPITSVAGRLVACRVFDGLRPGIVVSGGQHANETSGVVGVLRAARRLVGTTDRAFALLPLENPDGYALRHRMCRATPRHMLHAARYTGLGDDLEYRESAPLFETAGRRKAIEAVGAVLHVNLHGYPAHEWTRPFSGYLPRGFEQWSLPKGFFLVLRFQPGLETPARAFIDGVSRHLAVLPDLVAFNRRQLDLYRRHAGSPPFEVVNDMPCQFIEWQTQRVPFTLVTEYPDETISGAAFQMAHAAQMETVLAAFAELPALLA